LYYVILCLTLTLRVCVTTILLINSYYYHVPKMSLFLMRFESIIVRVFNIILCFRTSKSAIAPLTFRTWYESRFKCRYTDWWFEFIVFYKLDIVFLTFIYRVKFIKHWIFKFSIFKLLVMWNMFFFTKKVLT